MKIMYTSILCPIDYDANSIAALSFAARLARQNNATLSVLHVVREPFEPSEVPREPPVKEWEQDARDRLGKLVLENLDKKLKCKLFVRRGDPGKAILDLEREAKPDLIVMATHGRTGLSHLVLGSVAEHVVRGATGPVMTIRPF
jgi:universal stress protein A